MKDAFRIELLDQGWLIPSEPESDLCSHGHLRLVVGGVEVVGADESYGISESALAMLRTVGTDHTSDAPVADRLIFHGCGNILMMGCPIGADFSVRHRAGVVNISNVVRYDTTNEDQAIRFPMLNVELTEAEYRDQVFAFALTARQLFAAAVAKRFSDDFDATQHREFWEEFERLMARLGHAA